MDDSGNTAGALATRRDWARRRRIDPSASRYRCSDSCHQPIDRKTSSLTFPSKAFGLWPLKTVMSDML